jgi:hypothetical protein
MKDDTKHTPGPWEASTRDGILKVRGPAGAKKYKQREICRCYGANRADVDLIVAAPDLLAALVAIEPHAIGHSKPGCEGKARDPENCSVCKSIWAARDAIAKATGQ